MVNDALFSSDKNFWETPQKLFDELDGKQMGTAPFPSMIAIWRGGTK